MIEAIPALGLIVALIETLAFYCLSTTSKTPIKDRQLKFRALTTKEKSDYVSDKLNYAKLIPPKAPNFSDKTADFKESYERVGMFALTSGTLYDLRQIPDKEDPHHEYYVPFKIDTYSNQIWMGDEKGWLMLSKHENCMHCCRIDNFAYASQGGGKLPGIGSALIQFTVEKSLEAGFEGRVSLFSTNGSALFYYKMGFVSDSPEYQKTIEKAHREDQKGLDGFNMHLTDEAIEDWKKRIAENRISVP